jgi:hypothetical protein
MREMLVRSYLHRSRLDGAPALEAARLFARDIDAPRLLDLLGEDPDVTAEPRRAGLPDHVSARPGHVDTEHLGASVLP